MESIKNLFTPISERVKSPLYSTLIISWLVSNWKILFVIIFFNKENLKPDIISYLDKEYLSFNNCSDYFRLIFTPLLLSTFYIFGLPLLDLSVFSYLEKIKRRKIEKRIEIGKLYPVDGNLFYELKNDFQKEKEKVIEFEKERNGLKTQLEQFALQNKSLLENNKNFAAQSSIDQSLLEKLRNRKNISKIFEGRWKLTYEHRTNKKLRGDEEFVVGTDSVYSIIRGSEKEGKFVIMLPDFDIEMKMFTFVKYLNPDNPKRNQNMALKDMGEDPISSTEQHAITELKIIDNDCFEGYENKDTFVRYKKLHYKEGDAYKEGIFDKEF
jgi:hypothetical protein